MGTLATLISIELSAIAALHRLGRVPGLAVDRRHLSTWLIASSTEDVLAATLRLVALACAYWLLLSTTLYIAARLAHLPAAVRALEWATLPAVRRLADRALAVAFVSSTLTGGAGVAWAGAAAPFEAPLVVLGVKEPALPPELQPPPPPTLEVPCPQPLRDDSGLVLPPPTAPQPDVAPPRVLVPPTTHGLLIPPNPQTSPDPPAGSPGGQHDMPTEATNAVPKSSPANAEEFHEVARGDNLWHIAASTLRRRHGYDEVTNRRIAAYWRTIIDANRHGLRSGNPNLIFPGERVALPPVSEE
ncbi:MAG: LysM peptidoglycan-binding domain-containing protein [Actinomycetota bacterium]|nr:LysM peptidoglycan-binding domain-containing protein [Actinomycetota bacterium]